MLMQGFLSSAKHLLSQAEFESVLEVGCGPGDLAASILPPKYDYLGIDIDACQIDAARRRYPHLAFATGSAYELPVESKSRDLVIACEVLEHLDAPEKALAEIARVAKCWVLISVPWEPAWRNPERSSRQIWSRFGNTSGHVQHFGRRQICDLVQTRMRISEVRHPFPWTMVFGALKDTRPVYV